MKRVENCKKAMIARSCWAFVTIAMLLLSYRPAIAQRFGKKKCLAPAGASNLWKDFVKAKQSGAEPILPDFSYAGYRRSEVPIPNVKGPVFNVTKYGAT